MTRERIVEVLRKDLPELEGRYAVRSLALFGSAARDELRPDSDIDILVSFSGQATYGRYVALRDHLERLFGRRVDLPVDVKEELEDRRCLVEPHRRGQVFALWSGNVFA